MAIVLQDQSLHELQYVTDRGDVGVGLVGSLRWESPLR